MPFIRATPVYRIMLKFESVGIPTQLRYSTPPPSPSLPVRHSRRQFIQPFHSRRRKSSPGSRHLAHGTCWRGVCPRRPWWSLCQLAAGPGSTRLAAYGQLLQLAPQIAPGGAGGDRPRSGGWPSPDTPQSSSALCFQTRQTAHRRITAGG